MSDYIISLSRTASIPRPFPLGDAVNANPEWVSSPQNVTHNLRVTINFKKMDKKQQEKKKKRWEQPHVIGEGNSTPV